MRRHLPFAFALLTLAMTGAARADLQLSEHGAVANLHSERLEPGDQETFAAFLAQPRQTPLRIIYLDSRGGVTGVGIAIGQLIRKAGMDTAFRADSGRCVSACTTMFMGGVHRYYIGGNRVPDGIATHYGLGFHPGNGGRNGEERVSSYYAAMGVPGASALRYHVYPRESIVEPTHERNTHRLFFASGRSAIDAGVATSVSEPADPALRD